MASKPMLAPHYGDVFAYQELNAHFQRLMRDKVYRGRPHYAWGVLNCIHLARSLELDRVSVIEFGVAGGNGLLTLGAVARRVGSLYGVSVDVFGFDTGLGLPKPTDYRDLPNLFSGGLFRMDPTALKKRLAGENLVLGPIRDTLPTFVASKPAKVGFVAIDVDLHSSTVDALKLFDADEGVLLPRVQCYFDDILGLTYANFNGERLAIEEFNEQHELRKISPIYGLRYLLPYGERLRSWPEQMYLAHILNHSQYSQHDKLTNWGTFGLVEKS